MPSDQERLHLAKASGQHLKSSHSLGSRLVFISYSHNLVVGEESFGAHILEDQKSPAVSSDLISETLVISNLSGTGGSLFQNAEA